MSHAWSEAHMQHQYIVNRDDRRAQTRLTVARQFDSQVLRASGMADLSYLGFVAQVQPDRLRRARDNRGAMTSHHAARNGHLSVLR